MNVYRLAKFKFSQDLSGKGAEVAGGRWNSKGTALVYTCESRALCTTEIAVHTPLGIIPDDYHLITIALPKNIKVKEISLPSLPDDWKTFPHSNATQEIGDQFGQAGAYLVLKVPSAVVQGDFNFLLNPRHKDFNSVKIVATEPFEFDKRLFK